MAVTNHRNISIVLFVQLFGGQDDLDALSVVSARDRMVHDADCSDNLANRLDFIRSGVTWIANNQRSFGGKISASNSASLTLFVEENLVYMSVKHVGSTVDGAKS